MVMYSEIRLPLVITSDASRAMNGLRQARQQLNSIGSGLRQWGGGQLGAIGGMLSGYLGISGAIEGLRALHTEADRLKALATTWSPHAAQAKAQTQIAEMRRDITIGQALGPEASSGEELKQSEAAIAVSPHGLAAAGRTADMGTSLDFLWSSVKHMGEAALALGTFDFAAAGQSRALSAHRQRQALDPSGDLAWLNPGFTRQADKGAEIERRLLEAAERTARNTEGAR